ncbi:hypothetical protein BD626DRAFT_240865 [Schizophyllum amplum]|uniref:Uncharacterized protein n=1 Tax=Schizophyllum amplum TaxID=97359 RepID=A0A550CJZ1_9AGAR|nr:hypothetical protein BD626DRAFT_240865 [Auriculariopsis ampla]
MPYPEISHLDHAGVDLLQQMLSELAMIFMLYGVLAALFSSAIPALARRKASRGTWILTASITVLFISSTMGTVSQMGMHMAEIHGYKYPGSVVVRPSLALRAIFEVSTCVNLFLNDALVVWRAYVIWPNSRLARGLLLACVICSLVAVIFECVRYLNSSLRAAPFYALVVDVTLPATNIVATTLVGIRVWMFRRSISESLKPSSKCSRVGGILMILLESGLAYCAIWVVGAIIQRSSAVSNTIKIICNNSVFLLAAIYPTFLVVVLTVHEQTTTLSAMRSQQSGIRLETLRFASCCQNERQRREDLESESGGSTTGLSGATVASDDSLEVQEVELVQISGPIGKREWSVVQ